MPNERKTWFGSGDGNHAHIQIEFFIYKASHFPGFSLNLGRRRRGQTVIRCSKRQSMTKRIYDNVSKRDYRRWLQKDCFWAHVYGDLCSCMYNRYMCVIVCILCTLHMYITCNAQLYRHILCGTAWLKAKLNPREYRLEWLSAIRISLTTLIY